MVKQEFSVFLLVLDEDEEKQFFSILVGIDDALIRRGKCVVFVEPNFC